MGDPEEDEETVPWSTRKRINQDKSHVQVTGGVALHDEEESETGQLLLSRHVESNNSEPKVISTQSLNPESGLEPMQSNTNQFDCSSPSPGFNEATFSVSSESEDLVDDNYINFCDDSSEEDEEPGQERQFVPDNPLEEDQQSEQIHMNVANVFGESLQEPTASQVTMTPTRPAFQSTLSKLMASHFINCISSNACLSPREVLLNVLNLTGVHDVNHSMFVGICKLINSIFCEPILPDTSFKLDELLSNTCGMRYHYYCANNKCLKLLHQDGLTKVITCKCGFINDVSDLSKASYFVTFNICSQLEIILRDPDVASKLLDVKSYIRSTPEMRDIYDGEVYQNFKSNLSGLPDDSALHLSFVFCADGSPLYKSSGSEIWPFLGILNELPPLVRMKKTFLLGLLFGSGKPNFSTFFKPIVNSICNLSNQGVHMNVGGKETFVKIDCIGGCVDSAARGPIQGIHLHNGEYGCSWCLHPGESEEWERSSARKYKYLACPPTLRTHQQVKEDAQKVKSLPPRSASAPKPHFNGVVSSSPLLKLPHLNIVDGMVVDAMHNSYLGVTRQFLRLWCGTDCNVMLPNRSLVPYYVGSPSSLATINKRIALIIPPIEVRRLPRPLSDLSYYKAHELENFLLYFLFPVLTGILPKRFLEHIILYAQGMYLLMKDVILPEDVTTAEFLLDKFVLEIEDLYHNENVSQFKHYTYNVHLSLHAAQNARRWGSAWSVSAYAFENGIGQLKKVVHANKGIPLQVSRALCKNNVKDLSQEIKSARCASFLEELTPQKSVNMVFVNNVKVIGLTVQDFKPDEEEEYLLHELSLQANEFSMAKKILYNGSLFASRTKDYTKTRNDFVQLNDKQFVQLKKIIVSESLQKVLLICSFVHVEPYPVHLPSHLTLTSPFMYTIALIEHEKQLLPFNMLAKPCVYCNLKSLGGKETLSVMANVLNVF